MTKPLNIAHRGARSLAPENTLAAAQKALDVGADMWELDVAVTAGGELIVTHDDSLARTTNAESLFPDRVPWHFTTFTLAEIKTLDTGIPFIKRDFFEQIAAGEVSPAEQEALIGEPIPTLREALLFTRERNWRVNVEIKRVPPPMESFPIPQKVVALIEELDMVEQVLISSFFPFYLKSVRELNSAIDTAVITMGPLSPALYHYFLPPDPDFVLTSQYYFDGSNPVSFLAELGCPTYHPRYPMITTEEVKRLQSAGITVNIWSANDRGHMQRLVDAGVDGIFTDFPQVLAGVLGN